MMKIDLLKKIEEQSPRSAWRKGIKNYALNLMDNIEDETVLESQTLLKKALLNGALNWREYSEGGCAFIYDHDIAAALCTPSEYKMKDGGRLQPSTKESWLDVQSRALMQASNLIMRLVKD